MLDFPELILSLVLKPNMTASFHLRLIGELTKKDKGKILKVSLTKSTLFLFKNLSNLKVMGNPNHKRIHTNVKRA